VKIPENFLGLPFSFSNTGRKGKVGIVTPEIMGPSHGGVGTAYHALAKALADNGNKVTLLFVPLEHPRPELFRKWQDAYRLHNIHLELLPYSSPIKIHSLFQNAARSYRVMQWLKELEEFDVLHFPDGKGLGYYTFLSRFQGLAFKNTQMVLGAHSSTFWDAVYSYGDKTYYQDFLERNFLERESARMADFIISPSQYYLHFLKNEQKFSLPLHSYVMPNIMLSDVLPGDRNSPSFSEKIRINELVFFGRLEKRKGIILLCDALDHPEIRKRKDFSVSFMGHVTYIHGKTAYEYLKERSKNWQFAWHIIPRKNRDEALRYLQAPGRVALIPSLSETMSYTVLECLWAGIPFLASNVGGIPELIHPDHVAQSTFLPDPRSLSAKIIESLELGVCRSEPAFDIKENAQRWVNWHETIMSENTKTLTANLQTNYRISICVPAISLNKARLTDLQQQIVSQNATGNIDVEWIIGVSANEQKMNEEHEKVLEELHRAGAKIFFLKEKDNVDIRNQAAELSSGDYILFLENNMELLPDSLAKLLSVAQKTEADILTAAFMKENAQKQEKTIHFYLGACFPLGFLHNIYGENAIFIRKTAWAKMGGFPAPTYGQDALYIFLTMALSAGLRLETIPDPIFLDRTDQILDTKKEKFLHPHPAMLHAPAEFHDLLYFIQASRFFHDPAPDGSFTRGFINRPQVFVDELWGSRAWTLFLPLTNRIRKLLVLSPYVYPKVATLTEALAATDTIQQSLYWNLITPFMKARRWFRARKLKNQEFPERNSIE